MPGIFNRAIFNNAIFNTDAVVVETVRGGKSDNPVRHIYKPTGLLDRQVRAHKEVSKRVKEIVSDIATMYVEISAKVAPNFVDAEAGKKEQFNADEQRKIALIFALAESL